VGFVLWQKQGLPLLFESVATPTLMGFSIVFLSGTELRREICVT
jgi:hypothetical protein